MLVTDKPRYSGLHRLDSSNETEGVQFTANRSVQVIVAFQLPFADPCNTIIVFLKLGLFTFICSQKAHKPPIGRHVKFASVV